MIIWGLAKREDHSHLDDMFPLVRRQLDGPDHQVDSLGFVVVEKLLLRRLCGPFYQLLLMQLE